jgi:hypothetical protein
MSESDNQAEIMLALGRGNTRLFRNHVGQGWTGKVARTEGQFTILMNARRCSFGLTVGSSDLVGWHTVTITPDMVGKRVAVFTGIEVKRDTGGVTSEDQTKFGAAVQRSGGLWGVARNPDEARLIVGASL